MIFSISLQKRLGRVLQVFFNLQSWIFKHRIKILNLKSVINFIGELDDTRLNFTQVRYFIFYLYFFLGYHSRQHQFISWLKFFHLYIFKSNNEFLNFPCIMEFTWAISTMEGGKWIRVSLSQGPTWTFPSSLFAIRGPAHNFPSSGLYPKNLKIEIETKTCTLTFTSQFVGKYTSF